MTWNLMAEVGAVLMRRGQTGNGARLARLCARSVLSESAVPSGDLFHQLLLWRHCVGRVREITEYGLGRGLDVHGHFEDVWVGHGRSLSRCSASARLANRARLVRQ